MRISGLLAIVIVIGANSLHAQSTSGSNIDSVKLASAIGASYYHPDSLTGLDCGAVVDYGSLFKQLGQSPPDETRKQFAGITVKLHAMAKQSPKIDIAWREGAPANKESVENGIRQTILGFFQMYWSFLGSSIAGGKHENLQIEAKREGGYIWHESSSGAKTTLEIDSDDVPTKVSVDSPAIKAIIEFHFVPSEPPEPGDLRRLDLLVFSQQIGTTSINGRISIDYQKVEEFNVPQHLSIGVGGAYSLPLEFVNCSVAEPESPAEPK